VNEQQIIYLVWLVAVFVIRPPCFAVWVVCANALATLAVCGLMDAGALDRSNATLFMMLVDLLSGVALATRSGLSRVIAWGYALNVAIYSLNIVLGISLNATFALVYLIGLAQLGMLTIGPRGDNGYRNRRGRGAAPLFDAVPRRDSGIHAQGLGMGSNGDEVQG
jgi:hypothetical protein